MGRALLVLRARVLRTARGTPGWRRTPARVDRSVQPVLPRDLARPERLPAPAVPAVPRRGLRGRSASGVSCSQSGCHVRAPIACTTCHGSNGTPRPADRRALGSPGFCNTCHQVPVETTDSVQPPRERRRGDHHPVQRPRGARRRDGRRRAPPGTASSARTRYCHTPFTATAPRSVTRLDERRADPLRRLPQAPPANHARGPAWRRRRRPCANCHPAPPARTHIERQGRGHGDVVHGVPRLKATTRTRRSRSTARPTPSTRGVGAHVRHLDSDAARPHQHALLCNDCHVRSPRRSSQPGHYDQAQTPVRFPFGGTFDATGPTCTVWCHFDRTPGPVWTDDSGEHRKCDACHDFPPKVTRDGNPAPQRPRRALRSACAATRSVPRRTSNGVVEFVAMRRALAPSRHRWPRDGARPLSMPLAIACAQTRTGCAPTRVGYTQQPQSPVGLIILQGEDKANPWVDAEALAWAGNSNGNADVLTALVRVHDPRRLRRAASRPADPDRRLAAPASTSTAPTCACALPIGTQHRGVRRRARAAPVRVPRLGLGGGGRLAQSIGGRARASGCRTCSSATTGASPTRRRGSTSPRRRPPGSTWRRTARTTSSIPGSPRPACRSRAGFGDVRPEVYATQRSPSRLLPATSLFSALGDTPVADRSARR